MEHDLLGYALNALDPHDRARVEAHLRANPDAEARLDALRQALEPLSWDRCTSAPRGLADRTLAHVAAAAAPAPALRWPNRRLIELSVAAACLLTVTGLVLVWLAKLHSMRPDREVNEVQLVECRNNLQKLFLPLRSYADLHRGSFPNVAAAAEPPRNVAAIVYPVLHDAKLLTKEHQYACPGSNIDSSAVTTMQEVRAMDPTAFQAWVRSMQGSYAYSLGYTSSGQVMGQRLEEGKPSSLIPLMADIPPANPSYGNSAAHAGHGQHVLYADGHVSFAVSRHVGYNQDDIYLNRAGVVAAGVDWTDAVLSSGSGKP